MSSSRIDSKKPSIVSESSSNPESLFSTKTPNKTAILPIRSHNSEINPQIKPVKRQIFSSPPKPEIAVKLPERFEILGEFFNGLDSAIRLLKSKGSLMSFANICPKINYLTNRIFTYGDLAQMKHIYPEAIEVKRVLKLDEVTCCMKPSLHINLNTDAIVLDDNSCGTKYMELRKVFHSKLVEFYKAHPNDDIPKELLPEPFNSPQKDCYSEELEAPKLENEWFDVLMEEMEQEQDIVDKVIPDSSLPVGTAECLLLSHTESRIVGTPVKVLYTPSKELSTPIRLMSATPTLKSSRRCIAMTPDVNDDSVKSINDLERRPTRTRCLNFDALKEDGIVKDDISNESVDEDTLLHSIKEKPKTEESEKHNFPKLVSLIHKLFDSTKRTVITKEELLHKLIASQMDITNRREVEEQLSLMLQLVPDWISETKASSGDFLVRINKMSTAETVRARLEGATSQNISTVY